MCQFISQGGSIMYVQVFLGIIILVLSIKKIVDLFGGRELTPSRQEAGVNAIFFWGGINAVLGFYGHFLGIYLAMQAIKEANDIMPSIVAEGYAISLTTILAGLFIFLFSAVVWFFLRWRLKKWRPITE